jgi:hypothetical protein
MRTQISTAFCALAVLVTLGSTLGRADETGLAGMHSWQKVAGRTCLTDHEHDGSGVGPTPELAMRNAVRSWESFTDLEYGSDWASYANSVGKRASCTRGVSSFTCEISSRACRGGALSTKTGSPMKRRSDRR